MTMDEPQLRDLSDLLSEVMESRLDDSGWSRVDHALTLVEQSLGAGSEDWILGRNELFTLMATRAGSGLRDSLNDPSDGRDSQTDRNGKPAPRPTREHLVRTMRQIGHVPRQERRVDDSA